MNDKEFFDRALLLLMDKNLSMGLNVKTKMLIDSAKELVALRKEALKDLGLDHD